jgi:hypothetical protein
MRRAVLEKAVFWLRCSQGSATGEVHPPGAGMFAKLILPKGLLHSMVEQ